MRVVCVWNGCYLKMFPPSITARDNTSLRFRSECVAFLGGIRRKRCRAMFERCFKFVVSDPKFFDLWLRFFAMGPRECHHRTQLGKCCSTVVSDLNFVDFSAIP